MQKKKIESIEKESNQKLATLFKEQGITNLKLTSLGNSISSGYSMARITKPLLLRNNTLEEIMTDNEINLERHNFARAQNNNDEHTFSWLVTNTKESEINKLNRNDYSNNETSMPTHGINNETLNQYYPLIIDNEKGLQEIVLENDETFANIVVYNGCTGSFLDNITRDGKLSEKLTYGVKRDTFGIEAILKFIQSHNRKTGTNTQVYLCGAPNFLGLKISEIINVRLKNIAKKYANVTYVEPVKSKFFYKNDDLESFENSFKTFISKYIGFPDIHYDEEEYHKLNNNIIKSIIDNYSITKAMINIDRELFKFSSNLELDNQELIIFDEFVTDVITGIIGHEYINIPDSKQKEKFLRQAKKYLINRTPYDFHFLKKERIINSLEILKSETDTLEDETSKRLKLDKINSHH